MVGWIDVHAQFNGGEPHRLKVRCLGVTCNALVYILLFLGA